MRNKNHLIIAITFLIFAILSAIAIILIAPLTVFQIIITAIVCPLFAKCGYQHLVGIEFVFTFVISLITSIVFFIKYSKKKIK